MTTHAIAEILLSKSSFVVVTRRTTESPGRREVLCRARRTHLSRLGSALGKRMAISAIQPLPRAVISVAKTEVESDGGRGGATIGRN